MATIGGGGDAVMNLHEGLPTTVSGGSTASWSETWPPATTTPQVDVAGKSVVGSSVKVVGPPLTVAGWSPSGHVIANQVPVTLTGSLNVIVTLLSSATPVALSAGVVAVMKGAASPEQSRSAEAVLRAFGIAAAKSEELLSVSTQPPSLRKSLRVAEMVGAGLPSKKFAVP